MMNQSTHEQLRLFHDDLTLLRTKYTNFTIDDRWLYCEVLQYNSESNTIEFNVINGAWTGTLFLDNKTIAIHATKAIINFETISSIKPPEPVPEDEEECCCLNDDIAF